MRRILFTISVIFFALGLLACGDEASAGNKVDITKLVEAAEAAHAAGDYAGAEDYYRLVLALSDVEEQVTTAEAGLNTVIADQAYSEARLVLNELQGVQPPMPTQGMGQMDMLMAQISYELASSPLLRQSLEAVSAGLSVDPNHPGCNYMLGFLYAQTGDLGLAQRQFEHCQTIAPDHWAYERGMAQIYLETGKPDLALTSAEASLEKATDPVERMVAYELLVQLTFNPADSSVSDGYIAQAKEELSEYGDPVALEATLALMASGTPDVDFAKPLIDEALGKPFLSPGRRLSLVQNVSIAYAQAGQIDESISFVEEQVRESGSINSTLLQLLQQLIAAKAQM
ncbi:hypothetical protein K8R78_02705 [bacterium]|nr:hypothetical protein [bacterium]